MHFKALLLAWPVSWHQRPVASERLSRELHAPTDWQSASPQTLTMEKLNKKAEEKAAKAREAEDALTPDPSNLSLQSNVALAQRKEQEALDAAAKFAEHGFNES